VLTLFQIPHLLNMAAQLRTVISIGPFQLQVHIEFRQWALPKLASVVMAQLLQVM
jgi:hypothetical protein